jgi:thiol-disulfide isomerase/thioredoxin
VVIKLLPLVLLGVVAASSLSGAGTNLPSLKPERWVNSPPLTSETLRGKFVLVDFWEYTCVNWIRTAPYVKAWNRDYASLGLVVIGVHAPEFEFGKRAENIDRGIRDHGLIYPIAIDNAFVIWRAFGNDAWPAKYHFDDRGRLVRRSVGEGSYDEIEREIRRLLVAARPRIQMPSVSDESSTFSKTGQPSYAGVTNGTYIGGDRREPGAVTLKGDWHTGDQYVELKKGNGEIVLPFTAGEVNLVMQPDRRDAQLSQFCSMESR